MKRDYNKVEAAVLTKHYGWHEVNCDMNPICIHFGDKHTYTTYDDKGRPLYQSGENDYTTTWEYDDENNIVHFKDNTGYYEY